MSKFGVNIENLTFQCNFSMYSTPQTNISITKLQKIIKREICGNQIYFAAFRIKVMTIVRNFWGVGLKSGVTVHLNLSSNRTFLQKLEKKEMLFFYKKTNLKSSDNIQELYG